MLLSLDSISKKSFCPTKRRDSYGQGVFTGLYPFVSFSFEISILIKISMQGRRLLRHADPLKGGASS